MENEYGQSLISWQFKEYQEAERSKGWYIIIIILLGFLLIYAFASLNFLFAVIIIIGTITLIIQRKDAPELILFAITEKGILINESLYEYQALKDFYIIYKPPEIKTIYFNFKNFLHPRLAIPLQHQDPLKVKQILEKYLEEDLEKEEEPISENLKRTLKL